MTPLQTLAFTATTLAASNSFMTFARYGRHRAGRWPSGVAGFIFQR